MTIANRLPQACGNGNFGYWNVTDAYSQALSILEKIYTDEADVLQMEMLLRYRKSCRSKNRCTERLDDEQHSGSSLRYRYAGSHTRFRSQQKPEIGL